MKLKFIIIIFSTFINTAFASILPYSITTQAKYKLVINTNIKIHLSASIKEDKAIMHWSLSNNEDLNYLELQQSSDGINFSASALIFSSEKIGVENYYFKQKINKKSFYRLMILDKNKKISYSNTINLKTIITKE